MIIISHRGNLQGPNPATENNPKWVEILLRDKKYVEVDLWWIKYNSYSLGHNGPQYNISIEWLLKYCNQLFLHAKDIRTLNQLQTVDTSFNFWERKFKKFHYFYHENDPCTLTSQGKIWTYPNTNNLLGANSIAVLPEQAHADKPQWDNLSNCYGICTDYPFNYLN